MRGSRSHCSSAVRSPSGHQARRTRGTQAGGAAAERPVAAAVTTRSPGGPSELCRTDGAPHTCRARQPPAQLVPHATVRDQARTRAGSSQKHQPPSHGHRHHALAQGDRNGTQTSRDGPAEPRWADEGADIPPGGKQDLGERVLMTLGVQSRGTLHSYVTPHTSGPKMHRRHYNMLRTHGRLHDPGPAMTSGGQPSKTQASKKQTLRTSRNPSACSRDYRQDRDRGGRHRAQHRASVRSSL